MTLCVTLVFTVDCRGTRAFRDCVPVLCVPATLLHHAVSHALQRDKRRVVGEVTGGRFGFRPRDAVCPLRSEHRGAFAEHRIYVARRELRNFHGYFLCLRGSLQVFFFFLGGGAIR